MSMGAGFPRSPETTARRASVPPAADRDRGLQNRPQTALKPAFFLVPGTESRLFVPGLFPSAANRKSKAGPPSDTILP